MAPARLDKFSQINLADPEIVDNPYGFYDRLRAESPIFWSDTLWGGAWVFTSYEDVQSLLRDSQRLSNARFRGIVDQLPDESKGDFDTLINLHSRWMVFFDPPKHTRLRKLLSRGFTGEVLDKVRPFVTHLVDELLDAFQAAGEADLIHDYARVITINTIAEVLGVERRDRDTFTRWSQTIAAYMGSEKFNLDLMTRAQQSLVEFEDYFRVVIAERRSRPVKNDLLSVLIAAEEDGDILTEEELLSQCVLILFAGNETTKNLIGNGIYALLNHPDQLALLRREPSRITNAVEEILRFESPVQFARRVVKEDFEYKGNPIRKGQVVSLVVGAANYDVERYPDPYRLDITRPDIRHLSFGQGIHYCLGQNMARIEGQAAIGRLVDRLSNLRLTIKDFEWLSNPGFRGLKSLRVAFERQ
ncbi:MAG TPA: cytochrome P450 [Thermoanaerobaculia bacterium]|jgi:hypothetical protein